MKKIGLIGASGSIGRQTLDVINRHSEAYELIAVSVGRNTEVMKSIITDFNPKYIAVQDEQCYLEIKKYLDEKGLSHINLSYGDDALIRIATHEEIDTFVNAISGSIGIRSTVEAIKACKNIALANKETLVSAGAIIMPLAKQNNVSIVPIDSEHSAILQALNGEKKDNIKRLIITASGGSFRDLTRDQLVDVTVDEALNHPNWSMGKKITIDSSTMMNKALELIEAKWLFDLEMNKIESVLHRESTVHSMVEYVDTSIMAQLGTPDMRTVIQYALTYPERLPLDIPTLDFKSRLNLAFEPMNDRRYPFMKLVYDVMDSGHTMPAVMNAANEYAVHQFLQGKIKFLEIEDLVFDAVQHHKMIENPTLDDILYVDEVYKRGEQIQ